MEEYMDYEVINVNMKDEFKVCPSCGYKDGFHSMFRKEADKTRWLFICPSCHRIFDIGFTV
jgi:transposase-like protein